MNSTLAIEAARSLAARVQREVGRETRTQIQRAFALTLQRTPDRTELNACLRLAERRGVTEVCRALLNLNEFLYLD